MTDRELLELAAKAAGYDARQHRNGIFHLPSPKGRNYLGPAWNPLADDGDALRLAVALQLHVCNEQLSAGVVYCSRHIDPPNSLNEQFFPEVKALADDGEALGPADYAATRRAIVLAAAEIQQATEAK